MILVIPAIDLLEEHCVRRAGKSFVREQDYFDDPVKMAQLWRLQNARTLHVVGHDHGDHCRRTILKNICDAVDIPVQLAGGFQNEVDVQSAFEAGVYRIIVNVASDEELSFFETTLRRFGPRRIVASLRSSGGALCSRPAVSAVDLASELEQQGCLRIVYSDLTSEGRLSEASFEAFRRMANALQRTRITVAGGVADFRDLMQVSDLHPLGIDSVVIGRALYENRFPCQKFWCWNHLNEIDLTRFSTARLA